MEHRFKHYTDLERIFVESFDDWFIQHNREYNRVPVQMRNKLHMGQNEFEMQSKFQSLQLHRFAVKCRLEYSFNHFTDLERLKLAAYHNRKL